MSVVFVETPVFTKLIKDLLPHDSYVMLQRGLLLRPEAGSLIPGSGGLRKIRWGIENQGKRGGLRVIYYWGKPHDTIYMLFVFRKSEQEDLTAGHIRLLRRLVKEYLE